MDQNQNLYTLVTGAALKDDDKDDKKVVSGMKNKLQVAMSNIMPDTAVAGKMRKQAEEQIKKKKNNRVGKYNPSKDHEGSGISQDRRHQCG